MIWTSYVSFTTTTCLNDGLPITWRLPSPSWHLLFKALENLRCHREQGRIHTSGPLLLLNCLINLCTFQVHEHTHDIPYFVSSQKQVGWLGPFGFPCSLAFLLACTPSQFLELCFGCFQFYWPQLILISSLMPQFL